MFCFASRLLAVATPDHWTSLVITVVGGVIVAAVIGFWQWLRKSYSKFCEMQETLSRISESISKIEEHDEQIYTHNECIREHDDKLRKHDEMFERIWNRISGSTQ